MNIETYRQEAPDGKGTNYMMFLEYKGRRFAKPWILGHGVYITPEEVAKAMVVEAKRELKENWDVLETIGSPASEPLPEWVSEWEKFDF